MDAGVPKLSTQVDLSKSTPQHRAGEQSSNKEVQLEVDSSAGGDSEAWVVTTWCRRGLSVKAFSKPGERGKVSANALRSQYHDPGD